MLKEEWAENSLLTQRDGLKTLSDIIDHAKAKLDNAFVEASGGKVWKRDTYSRYILKNANFDFFRSQIENLFTITDIPSQEIIVDAGLNFSGEVLELQRVPPEKIQ